MEKMLPSKKFENEEMAGRKVRRINRVKSGIPGLDELIQGGFPERYVILVTGPAGSGKTIFALQYLVNGARWYGEKGLFLTLEQTKEDLYEQMDLFGWDMEELEKKGLLKIMSYAERSISIVKVWEETEEAIRSFEAKRFVLDSISTLSANLGLMTSVEILDLMGISSKEAAFMPTGEAVSRKTVMEIIRRLKALRVTSLLITELPEISNFLSRDGISEYMADGIIYLKYSPEDEESISKIIVRKMRATRHKHGAFTSTLKEGEGFRLEV